MLSQLKKLHDRYFKGFHSPKIPHSKEIPDILVKGSSLARTCKNKEVLSEHFIMVMLDSGNETAAGDYLRKCKGYELIEKYFFDRCLERKVDNHQGIAVISNGTKAALEGAEEVALELRADRLRAEHILKT